MPKEQPIEVFMPPNILKAKVGGSGSLDMSAIKRAEAAVEQMKESFGTFIADDVNRLANARNTYVTDTTAENFAKLYRSAHDLKGQGATFDFPLVARVAGSLSRLLGELPPGRDLPQGLTDAHVQAVQVIHRENIQDIANPMAQMLCAELDAKVTQTLAA